jgi:DNA mismatch repair protein MutL
VVKELTENSLDAGARRITVELVEGGLSSISVTDDGCGMGEEDLALAFERHATSKIKCASDLSRILTLGFRGEAIPSIAAVSRMDFTSRTADGLNGTMVKAVEGAIVSMSSAGCPPGSTVVVRDLFFNTPVRRKSMKSPSTEGSLCGEVISHMALARPDVSLELRNKNRRTFYSPGTGELIDAIISVYGVGQAREMIPVDSAAGSITLKGFIGKPSLSRSSKSHIKIIINGRYVHCPAVAGAVEEAYRTLLPHGRKPVAVLNLAVPPELIDVNVHPSKLEVRLLEEKDIVRQVSCTLREALLAKTVIPAKLFNPGKRSAGADVYQDLFTTAPGTLKKEKADSGGAAGIQAIAEACDYSSTPGCDGKIVGEKAADYLNDEKTCPK